jgi:16S rRNA (uracil1498-N3)-methyltransferase
VAVEHVQNAPDEKPRIILASALPKGPRQDFLIEKCTELGVNTIRPVIYHRSVVKPESSRTDKWRRTMLEAAKQCGRAWLPEIDAPVTFRQMIAEFRQTQTAYYAHHSDQAPGLTAQLDHDRPNESVLIAVGPEGGFTDDELAATQQEQMSPVTLGPNILRIETAAMAAVALTAAWRQFHLPNSL